MKRAVAILQPVIESEKEEGATAAGKVLLATVKGDVHDIDVYKRQGVYRIQLRLHCRILGGCQGADATDACHSQGYGATRRKGTEP